jgi:hypothetical protein
MPPKAVRNLRDLLYWQYAKIIAESAGLGKSNCARARRFAMPTRVLKNAL